jgi:hypothetical protein
MWVPRILSRKQNSRTRAQAFPAEPIIQSRGSGSHWTYRDEIFFLITMIRSNAEGT